MTENKFDPTDLLPLQPIAYQVLFILVGKELNGSEVLRAVREQLENDKIVTATLYRYLENLYDDGLIDVVEDPPEEKIRDRRIRKLYKLTSNGKAALTEETRRRLKMARELQQQPGFGDLIPQPHALALGGV